MFFAYPYTASEPVMRGSDPHRLLFVGVTHANEAAAGAPPGGPPGAPPSDTAPGGGFAARLDADLPGSLPMDAYLTTTVAALAPLGFTRGRALPLLGICRDELTAPFLVGVRDRWGNPFLLGGLAGQIALGRTGLSAAVGHAPMTGGAGDPARFVAYLLPHVGIDAIGEIGWTVRPGQPDRSTACGALVALGPTLRVQAGAATPGPDAGDLEQSVLASRVRRALGQGEPPELLGLTELVADLLVTDFLATLAATVELVPGLVGAEIAVLGGLLVHGPNGRDWVAPRQAFVVRAGQTDAREPIAAMPTARRSAAR